MKHIHILLCTLLLLASTCPGEEKRPEKLRVVSLSPSITEILFKLDRGDWLVGRTSVCDFPKDVEKIDIVGNFGAPSLEKLILLKPDIVLATALKDPSVEELLKTHKIRLVILNDKKIEDYYESVNIIGRELMCEEKAKKEIKRIRNGLANLTKTYKLNNSLPKKVYFEIWGNPYMTLGNKSFIDKFISYAGGKNIASDKEETYFNCSVEWIIMSNPDVIICPAMKKGGKAAVYNRSGWGNITAIQNRQVYTNFNDSIMYRLGPRMLQAIDSIHKVLFPLDSN